jgi:hypothetical protein
LLKLQEERKRQVAELMEDIESHRKPV